MAARLNNIEEKLDRLIKAYMTAATALDKIRDPRKRHSEPDKYTEVGCMMNIADQALQECDKLGFRTDIAPVVNGEHKEDPHYGIATSDVHKL